MDLFYKLFGNSSDQGAVVVQPTFDEAMCKRFNDFYSPPLPPGRVRPVFSEVLPPLELVASSNYKPSPINGTIPVEITPQVQDIFIKFFNQFEPFPSGLSTNCGKTLKVIKKNPLLFNFPLKWSPGKPKLTQYLSPIMCKLTFLGHVVEYVTKPVVLLWDKYIQDNQQPLDRHQEEYLSTLLQCRLLDGMNKMVEETKDHQMVYDPTLAEEAHFIQFKLRLEQLQGKLQQLQEQLELEKLRKFRLDNPVKTLSEEKQIKMTEENDKIFELGGSKYKRQQRQRSKRQQRQRSKRQQRQRSKRQKSKKYHK